MGLGETVNVLGFPFGRFLGTSISVAEGIVSAERTLYGVEYFQTDAAINPGGSGGPLAAPLRPTVSAGSSSASEVASLSTRRSRWSRPSRCGRPRS